MLAKSMILQRATSDAGIWLGIAIMLKPNMRIHSRHMKWQYVYILHSSGEYVYLKRLWIYYACLPAIAARPVTTTTGVAAELACQSWNQQNVHEADLSKLSKQSLYKVTIWTFQVYFRLLPACGWLARFFSSFSCWLLLNSVIIIGMIMLMMLITMGADGAE